jgi:hypothetical protein
MPEQRVARSDEKHNDQTAGTNNQGSWRDGALRSGQVDHVCHECPQAGVGER